MRVMSFNIFEGAQDTARYSLIKKLVRHRKVDVLCLQEANGWHEGNRSRLDDFAESTGLTECVFGNSNTDSKLAIFSRRKIIWSAVHTEGFRHCAMQAVIEGDTQPIELINAHLDPFNEDRRLEEARYLAAIGKDAILLGDMNSLSRSDAYPPALLQILTDLENERYGIGKLRYDVTDYLSKQGYIDMAAHSGGCYPTFPAMTGLERYQYPTRFDYVHAPAHIAPAIQNLRVIRDPYTRRMSDHRPIEFDLVESALTHRADMSLRPQAA